MATVAAPPSAATPETAASRPDMVVTLRDIGWDGFEAIAAMKGDRHRPRLLYSRGSLTLVSPAQPHEGPLDRLDTIIKAVTSELDIDCTATRSTLYCRRDLDRGVEGDATYYFANEPAIRGIEKIDLDIHPPPDLAVEIENTHPAAEALEIWGRLGVPETWVYRVRKRTLAFLRLDEQGRYVEAPASRFLPFLTAADILQWVHDDRHEPGSRWERRLRAWVRDDLARQVGDRA